MITPEQITELRKLCDAWLNNSDISDTDMLINGERMADLVVGLLHDWDALVSAYNAATALVTADGVVSHVGDKVFYIDPTGFVQGLDIGIMFRTNTSVPEAVYHPYPVYSTREAAEAAKKVTAS